MAVCGVLLIGCAEPSSGEALHERIDAATDESGRLLENYLTVEVFTISEVPCHTVTDVHGFAQSRTVVAPLHADIHSNVIDGLRIEAQSMEADAVINVEIVYEVIAASSGIFGPRGPDMQAAFAYGTAVNIRPWGRCP